MDEIHPILPGEPRFPILPARGPDRLAREQRRRADRDDAHGEEPTDQDAREEPDDAEWDGVERRGNPPGRADHDAGDRGDPDWHVDISA